MPINNLIIILIILIFNKLNNNYNNNRIIIIIIKIRLALKKILINQQYKWHRLIKSRINKEIN